METMKQDDNTPLWRHIEEEILGLSESDLGNVEVTVHKVAAKLDEKGLNVSKTAGSLLAVREAVAARVSAGHPLLDDLNGALGKLTLDDVKSSHVTAAGLVEKLAGAWPALGGWERIADLRTMVEAARLDLLISKAKSLSENDGIRLLRAEELPDAVILERMGIDQKKLEEVDAAIAKEKAEIARVQGLLAAVSEESEETRIKHLLQKEVSDELISAVGGFEQSAIDAVKAQMKAELEEQQRKAEEEAARRKAEAAGPSLEDIPPDQMLEYIESIREVLEFSDVEKEIRVMCEQSSVPKALVDIAVSDPDKLDELEKQAEG